MKKEPKKPKVEAYRAKFEIDIKMVDRIDIGARIIPKGTCWDVGRVTVRPDGKSVSLKSLTDHGAIMLPLTVFVIGFEKIKV